jgi:hypothetical protein
MKIFTLIYDPLLGHSVSDSKVTSFVSQSIDVFQRDGSYKSTFGNIIVIQEFISQIVKKEIKADVIEIFYVVGDKTVRTIVEIN